MTATSTPAQLESGAGGTAKAVPQKKCNVKLWAGVAIVVALAGGLAAGLAVGLSGSSKPGAHIRGTWKAGSGGFTTVTDTHWISMSQWGESLSTIDEWTNDYVITQLWSKDTYNPDKYSKREFHSDGANVAAWGYCSTIYDAVTAADAVAFDSSVPGTSGTYDKTKTSTDSGGCGTFSHTYFTKYAMPIAGTFKDDYGSTQTFSADKWNKNSIVAYSDNMIIYQNAADAQYSPGKWGKIRFHPIVTPGKKPAGYTGLLSQGFEYCQVAYAENTLADALAFDDSATSTSPYMPANSTHGCAGKFPFTIASAV